MARRPRTLRLPDRADPGEGGPLLTFLRGARGEDVAVSLAEARRLDPRSVETLVVAARAWHLRGLALTVTDVPEETERRFQRLGLTPAVLPRGPRAAGADASAGAGGGARP